MTYDYPTTELAMIEDARAYLEANGGTPAELAENAASHARFSRRRPDRVVTETPRRQFQPGGGRYDSTVREAVLGDGDTTTDDFPAPVAPARVDGEPVRPAQLGLVRALTRDIERMGRQHFLPSAGPDEAWTKRDTSRYIDRLREIIAMTGVDAPAPVTTPEPPAAPTVAVWATWRRLAAQLVDMGGAHGARFAIDTEADAINRTAFWWIVPGSHGDGRFFIRQVIGGQGAVRVRITPEAMIAIAEKIIAADPKAAMLRYGRELGECGHCGRTLTNDESRARGIGPVCARGKGW